MRIVTRIRAPVLSPQENRSNPSIAISFSACRSSFEERIDCMSWALFFFSEAAEIAEALRSRRMEGLGLGGFFLAEQFLLDLTTLLAAVTFLVVVDGTFFLPSEAAVAAAAAAFGASLRFLLALRLGVSGEVFIVTNADAIILAESILSFKSTQDVTCVCIFFHEV